MIRRARQEVELVDSVDETVGGYGSTCGMGEGGHEIRDVHDLVVNLTGFDFRRPANDAGDFGAAGAVK